MSAEKLAFLQNFYTDVTLYIPVEAAPAAEAPPVAEAKPVQQPAPAPAKPVREVVLPSKSYSQPSAGLERLAAGITPPILAPEPAVEPAQRAPAPVAARNPVSPIAQAPVPAVAPAVPPVILTRFTTLGDNAQGVVLLFRLPQEQFVKLHRNVFLNKMLQALGFVMADVVLVNVESDLPVALVNLRRELAATHIIAFGKNLLDSTIRNTQIYEPVLFPSLNLSYMASATVDLVEYDVSLKKRLWPGLQRMFGNAG
ncbi:hypothetical protein AUC43_14240 [Hymenobacter sedentarius]|uniref:Uncharacterized protein n=1 Tax=Hymenobacter sedentarius TaxID=1411621 RepID=A0A0U3SJ18_9BACT|nr:hypothetical protein [Hymenobacter sedentarius]ALW86150.1 hypothetical protein AUC43_14240 [Hymenobacter sedentarius]